MVITAQHTKLKPGYKQTEVGVIPEDWYVQAFSDICIKIQDGTHFSPKLGGNDYRYITSRNIRFGFLDISDVDWMPYRLLCNGVEQEDMETKLS